MEDIVKIIAGNIEKHIAVFYSDEEKRNMESLIISLLDPKLKTFLLLNEEELEMIRIRLGFFNNGNMTLVENMALTYGKSEDEINKILTLLFKKISFIIQFGYKTDSLKRMSSLAIKRISSPSNNAVDSANDKKLWSLVNFDDSDNYRNVSIMSIIDNPILLMTLFVNGQIYTLDDLLSYSIAKLKNIKKLGSISYKLLVEVIHKNGFKFIDELSVEEINSIIRNSEEDVIDNSPVIWLSSKSKDVNFLKNNSIKTIGDLKNNLGKCDIPFSVTHNCLIYGIFNVKLKNSITLLNLSDAARLLLCANGINSLDDLINKTAYEVQVFLEFNSIFFNEVTRALKEIGLEFLDGMYLEPDSNSNIKTPAIARVRTVDKSQTN